MSGTENTPDGLRADARENLARILVAAREVFAAKGLDATLADVARHAGVGVGTIYRRFKSKDELIEALFLTRLDVVVALAREAEAKVDPWEGLLHFLRESSTMMAEDHGLRDLIFSGAPKSQQVSARTRDQLPASIQETQDAIHDSTRRIVARAKESGDLRGDFEATDLPVLGLSIQVGATLAGHQSPDLWRRTMGIVIDGMRASRESYTPLEGVALTGSELADVMIAHKTRIPR